MHHSLNGLLLARLALLLDLLAHLFDAAIGVDRQTTKTPQCIPSQHIICGSLSPSPTPLLPTKAHWTFFSAFSPACATGLFATAEVIFHRPGATVPTISPSVSCPSSERPNRATRCCAASFRSGSDFAIFLISPLVQGGVVSLHQSSQGYPRLFLSFFPLAFLLCFCCCCCR